MLQRRLGDALIELDALLGVSGIRRCQPEPEVLGHQLRQVDPSVTPRRFITQQVSEAPPPLPRASPVAVAGPSSRSALVRGRWGLFQDAARDARGCIGK